MNNIFDIKRFGLTFRKDLMENGKRYTILFLAMIGIITIVNTWYSYVYYYNVSPIDSYFSNINDKLGVIIIVMFLVFGLLFASIFMSPMNSKTKKISYLSTPSSDFEKYLTRWLIMTVGYIISFFVALFFAEVLRVSICSAYYTNLNIEFINIDEYEYDKNILKIAVCIYFLFQSLFILGSTFWEKATFVKTISAMAIFALLLILAMRLVVIFAYGGDNSFEPIFNNYMNNITPEKNEEAIRLATNIISCIISFFAITNWVLAFFRLRESEIIKRL